MRLEEKLDIIGIKLVEKCRMALEKTGQPVQIKETWLAETFEKELLPKLKQNQYEREYNLALSRIHNLYRKN